MAAALSVPLKEAVQTAAVDLGISRDTDPTRRRVARERIEQERRERAAADEFNKAVLTAWLQAASCLRGAYKLTSNIKSEADFYIPGVAEAFHSIPILENILDGLQSESPKKRYEALCRWRMELSA
jgi:hypothetical protein